MDKRAKNEAAAEPTGAAMPTGNVADVLHAAATRAPRDAALIGPWGSRTWLELDSAASAGASALASAPGTGPGDRVVIALQTGLELAAALFATLRAGLVAVPVDPTRTEIAWVAERVGARLAITDRDVDGAAGTVSAAQVAAWWQTEPAAYDASRGEAAGEDLALLARGSRVGPPVMLSHRAILAAAGAVAGAAPMALRSTDRVLQVLPLFHVVGLVTAFLPAALAGAAVVVPDAPGEGERVAAAVRAVKTHRVSVLPAEPTLYRQLDRVDGFERSLGTVRLMTSGSSPLDPVDFAAIRSATGQSVREGYGISEASGAISSTLMVPVARPGSAGLPYPGVQIRIEGGEEASEDDPGAGSAPTTSDTVAEPGPPQSAEDADELAAGMAGAAETSGHAGTDAPESGSAPDDGVAMLDGITDLVEVTGPGGEVGRIAIRGATLFSGYWPDGGGGPDGDGWFLTGDIGYLDDAGELHLVDRATETVTVAGFTVYPREVEEVLVEHPLVADAAVVSLPGRGGQTVVAALVAKPGTRPTADDVAEFVVGSGLAPFKRPVDYLVVDSLPRTEVGRLDRSAVRHQIAAARGITLADQQPGQQADGQSVRRPIPLWRRLPGTTRSSGGVRRGAHDTDEDLF